MYAKNIQIYSELYLLQEVALLWCVSFVCLMLDNLCWDLCKSCLCVLLHGKTTLLVCKRLRKTRMTSFKVKFKSPCFSPEVTEVKFMFSHLYAHYLIRFMQITNFFFIDDMPRIDRRTLNLLHSSTQQRAFKTFLLVLLTNHSTLFTSKRF